MSIQPSSFIKMIEDAQSEQAVTHIYDCVDHLFGFEYSPEVRSDSEWVALQNARDERIEQLSSN